MLKVELKWPMRGCDINCDIPRRQRFFGCKAYVLKSSLFLSEYLQIDMFQKDLEEIKKPNRSFFGHLGHGRICIQKYMLVLFCETGQDSLRRKMTCLMNRKDQHAMA